MRLALSLVVAASACGRTPFAPFDVALVAPGTAELEAPYPTLARWNDYIRNADPSAGAFAQAEVPCDGTESGGRSACLHAGALRRVRVVGRDSCAGLTARDALEVFVWRCREEDGEIAFESAGWAEDRGLADLLEPGGFAQHRVVVSDGPLDIAMSRVARWWDNPVVELPENAGSGVTILDAPGTVYVLGSDRETDGYNVNADGIAIVSLGGAVLRHSGASASSCAWETGEAQGADERCVIAAGGQRFLWIEARVDAGATAPAEYGVLLADVTLSTVRNSAVTNAADFGIALRLSERILVQRVRLANNAIGLELDRSSRDTIAEVVAYNNSAEGVRVYNAREETLTRILVADNDEHGLRVTGAARGATLAFITAIGGYYAIVIELSDRSTLVQAVAAFGENGLRGSGTAITARDVTSSGNTDAGVWLTGSTLSLSGVLEVGENGTDCRIETGSSGLDDVTCATEDAQVTAGISVATAFDGLISSNDARNGSPQTAGTAAYGPALDWIDFASAYRTWGGDAPEVRGPRDSCSDASPTCRIWDWRLRAADRVLRGVNGGWPANAACPSEDRGVVTDEQQPPNTFRVDAVELLDDHAGDEDGLCESGEACRWAPDRAALLGDGSRTGPCAASDGVTLYR
jgi:hypothetical protein